MTSPVPESMSSDVIDGDSPAGSTLNAGSVTGVGQQDPGVRIGDRIRADQAKTAIKLAYWLVGIMVGSSVLHYAAIITLSLGGHADVAGQVTPIYDKWFPVITGFTGSAITYFLTKDRS